MVINGVYFRRMENIKARPNADNPIYIEFYYYRTDKVITKAVYTRAQVAYRDNGIILIARDGHVYASTKNRRKRPFK